MKKCPKCGCDKFFVSAHIVQRWMVDETGEFLEVVCDCVDVAHFPDNEDLWECGECCYVAAGSEFELPESNEKQSTI